MQKQNLIDSLVEAVLKTGNPGYIYDAYHAAKLGASTKAIDLLLKTAIKAVSEGEEGIDRVEEILKLKPSQEAIDEAFKTCSAEGIDVDFFKDFKPSQKIIDSLATQYLQKYEKLRLSKDWESVDPLDKETDLDTAVNIASFGTSGEIKDLIMKHCVQAYIDYIGPDNEGWLIGTAEMLYGDNPVPSEIADPAVLHELNGGWIAPAVRLSEGLRKKQTFSDDEITNAIKEMSFGFPAKTNSPEPGEQNLRQYGTQI